MNTLRAKLTALLVAAILLVVLLATGLSFLLLSPPRFEAADGAMAAQLALIVDLIARAPETGSRGPGSGTTPCGAALLSELKQRIADARLRAACR